MRENWHLDGVLGCWMWDGATNTEGYPLAKHQGRTQHVRRVLYTERVGPIEPGAVLRSTCKRKLCVNPAHLTPVAHAAAVRLPRARRAQRDAPRSPSTSP